MDERLDQGGDKTEEEPSLQDMPGPVSGEGGEGKEQRKPASTMEMLFREAEVIAQNLKESGTRR